MKNWFDNRFLDPIAPNIRLTDYTSKRLKEDVQLRIFTLDFLRRAEFNITDVLFKKEFQQVPDGILKMIESSDMLDNEKKKILEDKGFVADKTEFEHTLLMEGYQLNMPCPKPCNRMEPCGTMDWRLLIIRCFKNAFLSIDEIESSMHALLVNHFIREFLMNGRESKHAQLLVTTHNISLLNEKDLLRKDAVWFTNKKENGAHGAVFDVRF